MQGFCSEGIIIFPKESNCVGLNEIEISRVRQGVRKLKSILNRKE